MELSLIDGIGPFFRDVRKRRINWSKIPFEDLKTSGRFDRERLATAADDFARFVAKARATGYNSVTLDDLAHTIDAPFYPPLLRENIQIWRELLATLCETATKHAMGVYLTTDFMFWNDALQRELGSELDSAIDFVSDGMGRLFADFPAVRGVILRIGESDGLDVNGDFRSELTIRKPNDARRLLTGLLPVCEQNNRLLIMRTWSVGAYAIGDLSWNRNTFRKTFSGIDSESLIISMKHGESDFFRYLPLNKQFFRSPHKKIVEFQARREYEGFGEYPSFVGWEYERLRNRLRSDPRIIGIQVWAQTGGWTHFHRLTYLDRSSVWTELNLHTIARLFLDDVCTEEAVAEFARDALGLSAEVIPAFLAFLRLSDEAIMELLYLDDYARRKLFFRRMRMPPMLSVYWDQLIVSHSLRKLMNVFVANGEAKIRQGVGALGKVQEMRRLAATYGLPDMGLELQYDTFELLAVAREYFFRADDPEVVQRLRTLKARYKTRHRERYRVILDFRPSPLRRLPLRRLIALCLRGQRGYRLIDWVFALYLLNLLYPLFRALRVFPDFAEERAMGIGTVFK